MRHRLKNGSLMLLLLVWAVRLPSQPFSLPFQHLTPEQGLFQTTSRSLFRCSKGFMWIGTTNGLYRFDGRRLKHYGSNPLDSHTLRDPVVVGTPLPLSNGDFWVGTHKALHRYRRAWDGFERFPLDVSARDCYPLLVEGDKRLLLRAGKGLYRFQSTKGKRAFEPVGALPGQESMFCPAIGHLQEGYFLSYGLRAEVGLFLQTWKAGKLSTPRTFLDGRTGQASEHVFCVWLENPQLAWVGTAQGLLRLDLVKGTAQTVALNGLPAQPAVNDLLEYDAKHLLLGTSAGLWLVDKNTGQTTAHWQHQADDPYALMGDAVAKLYRDFKGVLWVSVWGKGIHYVNPKQVRFDCFRFEAEGSQGKPTVFMPTQMAECGGRLWLAGPLHGLCSMRLDGSDFHSHRALLARTACVVSWDENRLLATDLSGMMYEIDPKRGTKRPIMVDGQPLVVVGCCSGGTQDLWLTSTPVKGLCRLSEQKGRFHLEALQGEWPSADFYFLHQGPRDTFYAVDFQDRLWRFKAKDGRATDFQMLHTFQGYAYHALTTTDHVWIGGAFGLTQINRRTGRLTLMDKGLPDPVVYALQVDDEGYVWLTGNQGITRYDPYRQKFWSFGMSHGLQGLEFNRVSFLKASDGSFWVGGVNGLNRFDPHRLSPTADKAPVELVGLSVNDAPYPTRQNIGETERFCFPYDSSTLSFEFVALDFSDPARNRLQYQLFYSDGSPFDPDSVLCPDAHGFARYPKLPPGQYRLRLKAANADGVWNPDDKEINISIRPPFWQTAWFRLMALCLLAGVAYAAYRYRLAQVRREASLQLDQAEAEMKALRAQLTPHFVFNNLNTVRAFLLRKDLVGADAYLGSFARLMRAILESSLHHTVPLSEELDLLREYVATASKALLHPLRYEENITTDIDCDETRVPGMLLQPFVENALIHGLRPKAGAGTITVEATQDASHLFLSVEDDGVGRSPTEPTGTRTHRSRALQLIEERLRYYDLRHATRSSVHFVDLQDTDGKPCGTRVVVCLGKVASKR